MFLTKSKPNPGQIEKTTKEENYVSLQIPEYWREVFRKRLEDIISETSCQKSPARGNTQLENTTKQGTQNSQLNDIILGSGEPCLALSFLVDIGIAYPPFPQEMFPPALPLPLPLPSGQPSVEIVFPGSPLCGSFPLWSRRGRCYVELRSVLSTSP